MTISLNQFSISPKAGDYASAPNNPIEQMVFNSVTSTDTIAAGAVVKISGAVGSMVGVVKAGVTDVPYGVVVYSPNKETYAVKDVVGIATAGDILWLQSTAAAITAGAKVEFDANGLVLASAGTNKILGIALTAVPAAGGLVKVKIIAPNALQ